MKNDARSEPGYKKTYEFDYYEKKYIVKHLKVTAKSEPKLMSEVKQTESQEKLAMLPKLVLQELPLPTERQFGIGKSNYPNYILDNPERRETFLTQRNQKSVQLAIENFKKHQKSSTKCNNDNDEAKSLIDNPSPTATPSKAATLGAKPSSQTVYIPSPIWQPAWSGSQNLDNQREYEERLMHQIIDMLNLQKQQPQTLPTPLGGIYVRLETEWRKGLEKRWGNFFAGSNKSKTPKPVLTLKSVIENFPNSENLFGRNEHLQHPRKQTLGKVDRSTSKSIKKPIMPKPGASNLAYAAMINCSLGPATQSVFAEHALESMAARVARSCKRNANKLKRSR